jgi:hypothetical protein
VPRTADSFLRHFASWCSALFDLLRCFSTGQTAIRPSAVAESENVRTGRPSSSLIQIISERRVWHVSVNAEAFRLQHAFVLGGDNARLGDRDSSASGPSASPQRLRLFAI